MLGTIYLTKCMLRKCLQRKRGLPIVLLGLFVAALGILVVASVARNRELQSPWYMQRSATILFENPVSPKELYSSLHGAFHEGSVNGYALIADVDVSGGISLGAWRVTYGILSIAGTTVFLPVKISSGSTNRLSPKHTSTIWVPSRQRSMV